METDRMVEEKQVTTDKEVNRLVGIHAMGFVEVGRSPEYEDPITKKAYQIGPVNGVSIYWCWDPCNDVSQAFAALERMEYKISKGPASLESSKEASAFLFEKTRNGFICPLGHGPSGPDDGFYSCKPGRAICLAILFRLASQGKLPYLPEAPDFLIEEEVRKGGCGRVSVGPGQAQIEPSLHLTRKI